MPERSKSKTLTSDEPAPLPKGRMQAAARQAATKAYPFACCVVCGLQIPTCLTVAHLDHDPGNNAPENLAFMCQTHHWMYDAGLYPLDAIVLMRVHWQATQGVPSHKARMKDAGAKAAKTRRRRAAGRKAAATKRQTAASMEPLHEA